MNFNLFGFDFYAKDKLFGFWIAGITLYDKPRSLLCIYYSDGEWRVELFYKRII